MTFQESISTCLSKYADFSGRASRPEYWWFVLASFIALAVGSAIAIPVGGIIWLGLILPMMAAAVRRLHDTNRSGWLLLLGMIPLAGIIVFVWAVTEGDAGSNQYGERAVA